MHGRSEHSQNIQSYFGCYDPLSYPLFYPNGESGWHDNIPRHGVLVNNIVNSDNIEEETEGTTNILIYFLYLSEGKKNTITCKCNY